MRLIEIIQLVAGLLAAAGGICAAVFSFLGKAWMQRMQGNIDTRLHHLDSALKHRNFLLQRFAELELDSIAECWGAARACLPLINATRPYTSGTDEAVLVSNFKALAEGHDALMAAIGRHEPFLPVDIVGSLDAVRKILAAELWAIQRHPHFKDPWWEEGEKNRTKFEDLCSALLGQVKGRAAQLRAEALVDQGRV